MMFAQSFESSKRTISSERSPNSVALYGTPSSARGRQFKAGSTVESRKETLVRCANRAVRQVPHATSAYTHLRRGLEMAEVAPQFRQPHRNTKGDGRCT